MTIPLRPRPGDDYEPLGRDRDGNELYREGGFVWRIVARLAMEPMELVIGQLPVRVRNEWDEESDESRNA